MDAADILARLRPLGSERNRQGMARFGINTARALGVGMVPLRAMARETGRDHALALALWETGVHEARILACMTADPARADKALLDAWAADCDSWDVTDQFCNKLAVKCAPAWELADSWSLREEEFVRRAGFSLMAQLAVHDRTAADEAFEPCLERIVLMSGDGRNFVKKAVNWALRQIGKRSQGLRLRAEAVAGELAGSASQSARWIGRDALREFAARPVRPRRN
ncbi:DNA alkylation repair protein [Fundidesulfovibrio agrisoli]|uniref:DNA alkylation repair protein n=1 Tax=Fundidesulfovibrio agrisoli TaxID=2922717 RepID=UPI001FACE8BE|nr:DNA alkylation repair protein [Fundidesulfovibrio agrisoli]